MLQFGSNLWYYNKNIKNMLIGFLNLFPQMKVKTLNSDTGNWEPDAGNTVQILFGPIERSSYINSRGESVQRTVQLPLLQFELTGMEHDKTRAFAEKTLHIIGARSGYTGYDFDNLMPYPYTFNITMNIYAKYQEDLLQLIEQIVPIFNYHRVYYTKHPIFPEDITLHHWASITTPPSFAYNYEYSAEQRRDILAVPIGFTIESWMVREAYEAGGIIKEVVANFKDYATSAGLSSLHCVGDPSIRDVIYTRNPSLTPIIGQIVTGNTYNAVIVDVDSGYSGYSEYWAGDGSSGWSGYSDGHIIVKFGNELGVFLTNEVLKISGTSLGTSVSCEPYKPFMEADYGWSGYTGVSTISGWSEYHTSGWCGTSYYPYDGYYSGYSTYYTSPPYSGFSEWKVDAVSGVL